ncbi:ATP-binding protein [Nocardioides antri]|uniref:ATP-binding protein n=1 Tax=Nocardioides antri TaxID=2607659 RepID=A0A5B1M2Q3_9ACTN|nr:ATP-binding protein [Nocardioides antri]KAA1427192.1 ATP-binding protein [Nocardioides antri]
MPARVIVLAGPSGAGKSRLAERLRERFGWPTLRLDDFYRDGDEEGLPRIEDGANAGLVDWDHSGTWHQDDAVAALVELCRAGAADVPVYSIAESRRTAAQRLDLDGAEVFCAEGIFAPAVVEACREAGVLEAAYCITQHRAVTFWRRLTRDLREHRKPPLVLVRRGLALARGQREVVRRAVAVGCTVATGDAAYDEIVARQARNDQRGLAR